MFMMYDDVIIYMSVFFFFVFVFVFCVFFFFKQKTAYEIGTGDWSSDVCSSDLFLLADEQESDETLYPINLCIKLGLNRGC